MPSTKPKHLNSKKAPVKRSPLRRALTGLYIALVCISLVVIAGYIFLRFSEPSVDMQVTFHPAPTPSVPAAEPSPEVTPRPGPGPEDSPEPDPSEPAEEPLVLTRRDGVFTCLLLGTDASNNLADTIMLGVFDTRAKTASLVSVPRDTVVNVNGRDRKINSTFGLGGAEQVAQAVSDMLAVPVDYYVSVRLQGFVAIVDEIGGVWFDVPVDMDYDDPWQNLSIHISAGYQLLDGQKAMGVVRCRNCYVNADIGRVQTQRAFLSALVSQTITISNVTKVTSLINILNTHVSSNMPANTMIYFATQAIGMDLGEDLTSQTLEGEWTNPFYELDDDAALELVNGLGIYEEEVPASVLNIRHP